MRRLLIAGATTAALALSACATEPATEVAGTSWLVTDIWTTPGAPSSLPSEAAGRARLTFGEHSMTGYTGCAPLQGTVSFTRGDEDATVDNAHTFTVDRLEVGEPAEDCPSAAVHEQLTELIEPGAVFDVRHEDRALVLTLRMDAIDRPAIGLAAI